MDSCHAKGIGGRILSRPGHLLCVAQWLVLVMLGWAGPAQAQLGVPGGYGNPGSGALNPSTVNNPLDTSGLNAPSPEDQNNAPGPPVPPLQIRGAVSMAGVYATNPQGGTTPATDGPDEYAQATFQTSVRYNTRRAQLVGDYSFLGDFYGKYHNLNAYLNYLDLASQTQVIPDHLVLNVTAFATPILLNRTGALSASGVPVSSTTSSDTYGYVVQPEYLFRVRNYFNSITTLSQSGVYFVSPFLNPTGPTSTGVSNASTVGATQRFTSGDYFGRFNFSLNGDYQKLKEQSFQQLQKDGTVDLAYALDHNFQLLGTGGYNQFEANVPLNRALSGPEALGGFLFTPSPSMKLTAEAGVRNRSATYIGSLHWNLNGLTALDGILTDGIYTPQGSILNSLGGFGSSLLNPQSGIGAFSPSPVISPIVSPELGTVSPVLSQGLAIDNFIYHDRLANVTLTHTLGRTTLGITFYNDYRTQLVAVAGAPPNSSLNGITVSANHQLHEGLSAYAAASYSSGNEFGGNDQIFYADVGFNWNLSDSLSLYGINRYLYHEAAEVSIAPNFRTYDDEMLVGIRHSF